MLRSLIICLLVGVGLMLGKETAQAQVPVTASQNKVIIEGKIYFLHIVKPGQTLYSISKAYQVTEKDIAIENPGVYTGLQIGQILKIPSEVPRREEIVEEKDSMRFIYHRLRAEETLYSLSRVYNVSVERIMDENPGIDVSDLSIGQSIKIPRVELAEQADDFDLHRVRRRETLFSLSRRYDVSEDDIRKYNPGIGWGGIKTGQVIRIPKKEYIAKQYGFVEPEEDTTEVYVPGYVEALGYIDSLDLEQMTLRDYRFYLRDFNTARLKVAYLIPFNYRPEEPPDSAELADMTPEEEEERRRRQMLPRSLNFLEFFEGSLLALDSLKKEGYRLDVRFFDTYRSPGKVREILQDPFLEHVDLIIGPFYNYNVEIVSEFSRRKNVPMVSPFYEGYDLTMRNPFLFQVNPSYKTEYKKAADILANRYDKNFIFVYQEDSSKYHEVEFFKDQLIEKLGKHIYSENIVLKEISYANAAKANLSADLSHALSHDKENIVVIPESNEAFVSTVITQLYYLLREFDIEVFGRPHFHEYKNIDFQYYHALNLNYLSPFHYDFSDRNVSRFLDQFKANFFAEPSFATRKGCPYAFIGFDISYYFIKNILEEEERFVMGLDRNRIETLIPGFHFKRNDLFGGFENQFMELIKFQDDFEISDHNLDYWYYP